MHLLCRCAAHAVAAGVLLAGPGLSAEETAPVQDTSSAVMATVDGEVITRQEVEERAKPALDELATRRMSASDQAAYREMVLDGVRTQLIEERLLANEGQRVANSNEALKRQLDEQVRIRTEDEGRKLGGEAALRDSVKARGMSWQQYVDGVRLAILREMVIYQFVTRDLIVGPEEIREYYRRHEAAFSAPERVQFRRIFFRVGRETERQAAYEKALGVLAEARAGKPFAALAERYSEDARDGRPYVWDPVRGIRQAKDLAKIETEGMVVAAPSELNEALRTRIQSTPIQALTDPVETERGFVLICVEARFPAEKTPLEKVQRKIEAVLLMDKRQVRYSELIERLRRQSYVELGK